MTNDPVQLKKRPMKIIIYLSACMLFNMPLFAQDPIQKSPEKGKALSVYFSGTSARIVNANWTSDNNLEIHNPICFSGGIAYTKYLNEHLGLTMGIEYSTYKTNYRCAQYNKSTTMQTDPLGQNYYTITQADYSVNRNVGNIEIPLCLRYESGAMNKTRFFGELGVKVCSAISGKKTSTGTVTTMALYPDPHYSNAGFLVWDQSATNDQTVQMISSDEYNCKAVSLSFCSQAGIVIPMCERLQFTCALNYVRSFGDINESEKGTVYINYLGGSQAYKPSVSTSLGMRMGVLMNFRAR
jgi:hypothetical protein